MDEYKMGKASALKLSDKRDTGRVRRQRQYLRVIIA
jgi:hypothetical protein